MATLEFLTGKVQGTTVGLKEGRQVIGNRRSADIPVRGELSVSWDQAAITFENGKYFVEDMKSKKGSFLNGEQLKPGEKKELPDGATLKLGEVEARFSAKGAAPAAPAAGKPAAGKAAAPKPAAAAKAGAAGEEKKLSLKERIALRKKQAAAKSAGKAADAEATKAVAAGADKATAEKIKEKELESQGAIRELTKARRELEAAKAEIARLKEGGDAELRSQNETLLKDLSEKDEAIHNLELAVQEARAGVGAGSDAVDADDRVAKLQAELDEAQDAARKARTEKTKLEKALERSTEEIERLSKRAEGDVVGGYSGEEEENEQLRAALAEKTVELDGLQAEVLESREVIEKLQNRIRDFTEQQDQRRSGAERQLEAMEEKVGEYLEQKHSAEKELQRFKKEYDEFEERVIELQAQVDDLTERNDIMQYKLEQAEQKVGELVRGKIVELQHKVEETTQQNQQLQSLVEAYEEKIDEMDVRIEEMEGEIEELESLLKEEREEHEKTKQEAEKNERALRKRLQLAVGEGSPQAMSLEEAAAESQ